MAGCDGSLSSKDCKTCNGRGSRFVPVIDPLSKRLKNTVAVCLGKRNEIAEMHFPDLMNVPSIEESDLAKINHGLENCIFIGNIEYVNFSAKKLVVKNYPMNNFRVFIGSSSLLMENYSTDKFHLSDYLDYNLLVLSLGKIQTKTDINNIFKSAVFDLIKLRTQNKKPTWIHVPKERGELAACLEYSTDLDAYVKDYKVIRKSLGSFNSGSDSRVSTNFSSI